MALQGLEGDHDGGEDWLTTRRNDRVLRGGIEQAIGGRQQHTIAGRIGLKHDRQGTPGAEERAPS